MMADVQITKLTNGVRVISSRMPHMESVTLGIWVGTGGRNEPAEVSGVSHFIEHMLFKGTLRRSARQISEAIEGRGGYFNAFTQEESTCYYARVAYDQLGRTVDVLSDMFQHSLFGKTDLDKERGVIIEEIMMYHDQPQQLVQEMLGVALWMNHPLGRAITGSPETMKAMTRGKVLEYMDRHYTSGSTVFAFAGKVEHSDCVREVARCWGRSVSRSRPAFMPVTTRVAQSRFSALQKDIEQVHVAMGVRLFGRDDHRRYALRIMNAALGENMSSRLFRIVREKHGLAYSIHSSIQLFLDTGVLVISAGLDRRRSRKAVDIIVSELARLKAQPVGVSELRRAKDYVTGQIRLGWESTTNQMMWLGENLLARNRFISPDEIIRELAAVTADDVHQVASEVMRASKTSVALIYPDATDRDLHGIEKATDSI